MTRLVPTAHVQCASQDIPGFCIGMTYDEVHYPSQSESNTQFRRLQCPADRNNVYNVSQVTTRLILLYGGISDTTLQV